MKNIYLRQYALTLCLGLFSLSSLYATTFRVSNTSDDRVNPAPGSLRNAINSSASGDSILFDASTNMMTIMLDSVLVINNKNLTIIGNGMTETTLDGKGMNRIFRILGTSQVSIRSLTIQNGSATTGGGVRVRDTGRLTLKFVAITACEATGGGAGAGGGGIASEGTLILNRVFVTNNTALGTMGSGGGVLNQSGGTLYVKNSVITGNAASRAGGGIEDASGEGETATPFEVSSTMINDNTALGTPGNGGGIHVGGNGQLTVRGGQVNGNVAASEGGGIWIGSGSLVIRSTEVDDNEAQGDLATMGGGGLFNLSGRMVVNPDTRVTNNRATGTSGSGGGILNLGGSLLVNDATVGNNSANRAGGGIEDASGPTSKLTIFNARIDSNTAEGSPGNGGGIHVGAGGGFYMRGGSVSNNTAASEGGGLWNDTGRMSVRSVDIFNNEASGETASEGGGGIYNNGGMLLVDPLTVIDGNTADGTSGSGGGILNAAGGMLVVNDATVSNNVAMRAGGGIEDASGAGTRPFIVNARITGNTVMNSPGNGGGIHVGSGGDINILRGTISNNSAGAEGGGLWNDLGNMTVRGTLIDANTAAGDDADKGGGGIYNNGGTLIVNPDTRITNNLATGAAGSGGGILNAIGGTEMNPSPGTLRINDATISNNSARRAGGGIEDASGPSTAFTIVSARINDNSATGPSVEGMMGAPGNGGGIHVGAGGNVNLLRSVVSGNTAASEGGGLWNDTGLMTVREVTVSNNVASGPSSTEGGGGIYNNGGTLMVNEDTEVTGNSADGMAGSGGGILNAMGGTLTVTEATINGNTANRAGGGIEDASGEFSQFTIVRSVIDNNEVMNMPGNGGGIHVGGAGSLTISRSSVSGNTAGAEGGGLWNGTGIMTVMKSTIDANEAAGDGGPGNIQGGGGIYNDGGAVEISENTRITGNRATGTSGSGGGILSAGDPDVFSLPNVIIFDSEVSANSANRAGGGVEIALGNFRSANVDYDGNDAGTNAANGAASPGNGGAFHVTTMEGAIDFNGGSVTNNSAANQGGGLWNQAGVFMEVTNVIVRGNSVTSDGTGEGQRVAGAGVYNNGGDLNINQSAIVNNTMVTSAVSGSAAGTAGGGIANYDGGSLSVLATTIAGNTAEVGGGILNVANADVQNVTITNNTAATGGGVFQAQDPASTSGNAAVISFQGNILAGNTAATDPDFSRNGGDATSGGYNFLGQVDASDLTADTNDKSGADAQVSPVQDGNGNIFAYMPDCGSPVIGMGNPTDTRTDQLGQEVVGQRDIGSYELQGSCASVVSGPGSSSDVRATEAEHVGVYPNPVSGNEMNVKLPRHFEGDVTLQITDAAGRVHSMITSASIGSYKLQLADYPSGSYNLQVVNGETVENVRFVISR